MAASHVHASRSTAGLDIFARPVAVAEVLQCGIEVFDIERKNGLDHTCTTFSYRSGDVEDDFLVPLFLLRAKSSIIHDATM